MDKTDQLCIECDCGHHYLTITYYEAWKDEPAIAYLTIDRGKDRLWYRIIEAVKLVLGIERNWVDFSFDYFGKVEKLEKMIKKMKRNIKEWEEATSVRPQD